MTGGEVTPRRRRDRRGRSLRGALLPARLPAARSRAGAFEELVAVAADRVMARVAPVLADLEVDVELVPESTEGGLVSLFRVEPAGASRPPRVVVHRRPIEARAKDQVARSELVHDVLVDAVAELMAVDPETIDPDRRDD